MPEPTEPTPGATPTEPGAKPEPEPTPLDPKTATVEQLLAENERLQRTILNKTEETTRLHKKVETYEKAEEDAKKAAMTETEKLKADLEASNKKLTELTAIEQRRTAAEKVGLPLAFADRLKGATPEELEADAKKLLEALPKAPKNPPVNPTNPGPSGGVGETYEAQRARIHGQSVGAWDSTVHRQQSGGVYVLPPKEGAAEQ